MIPSFHFCLRCERAIRADEFATHLCESRDHAVRCTRHNNATFDHLARCECCLLEDQS